MEELSILPPDDPLRREFVAALSDLDEETRIKWLELVRETEMLRGALERVNVPADFTARLLALQDEAPLPMKASWKTMRMPKSLVAAVLVLLVGGAGYLYWQQDQPPAVVKVPEPPSNAVDAITLLAVNTHAAAAPLDILSSDAEGVRAALQAKIGKTMPFPVILPTPDPSCHLLGGTVCAFGTTKAVETRWQMKDQVYTLFQFAPGDMGMPHVFAIVRKSPSTMQAAMANYSVAIWPGMPDGVCTWAVVSARQAGADPFSNLMY